MDLPSRTPLPADSVPTFDHYARLVADRLDVPVALVSLVDIQGQAFPGAFGLAEPWMSERWTPLSHSFCQHVVTSGEPLVVENAHDVPLVAGNLAVMELGVIAYAGMPLRAGDDGPVIGSMCAIDHRPRQWSQDQLSGLAALAEDCSQALKETIRELPTRSPNP